MTRKADFTNQALSIIIAVIGLALLIYGVVLLFRIYSNDEFQNAGKTIDTIENKIKAVKGGESARIIIPGFEGSSTWYITGFTGGAPESPDKCFFNSCVCICKGNPTDVLVTGAPDLIPDTFVSINNEKVKNQCQDSGYCRDVEFENVKMEGEPIIKLSGKLNSLTITNTHENNLKILILGAQ